MLRKLMIAIPASLVSKTKPPSLSASKISRGFAGLVPPCASGRISRYLPRNHFGAILADPPWDFRTWSAKGKVVRIDFRHLDATYTRHGALKRHDQIR
jgi:hypothetical protein